MAEKLSNSGTIGAANEFVALPVSGMGGVAVQVQGTFSGTITFEASVQGQDFAPFRVVPSDNSTAVTTATAAGLWVGSTVGYLTVRARFSSYTSGKATVFLQAELASPGGSSGGSGTGSDVNLIEVGGSSIALGQAAMAASLPVVIASDQTAIPITGSITASNPSVGPTGDPVPAEATLVGFQEPGGDLAAIALESFDYDSGAGTQAQTAIGLVIPASGGPVPVGPLNPLPIVGTGTAGSPGTAVVTVQGIGSGTAVPVSAAALPLPSGAATEATLAGVLTSTNFAAAFGAAGTPDTQVLSVQGISSMTPLLVTPAANSAVNVAQINGVTPLMGAGNTGTGSPRVTIATDQAVIPVGGNVAADAVDSGNPVKIGMIAYSPDGTTPGTAVAELDRSNAKSDLDGRLFVNPNSPRSLTVHLDGSSAYTDQALIADPGDGFQAVITNIIASTGAATALNFFLEEGSTKIFGPIYLEAVAGRGFCSGPMYLPCTASTAVTLTSSASIAQSFQVSYFIQAV